MSEVTSSRVLVKNATLWRWGGVPSDLSKAGSAVPCSWFCIENGMIYDISDTTGGQPSHPLEGGFCRVIDAKHRLVIPGLHDAHIHVSMTGESSYFLNLNGCDSIDKLIVTLSAHSVKFPVTSLPWIQGVNWDQTDLGRYPTRADLDRACPDRPVFLWRACWHIGVANTRALQLAGIIGDCTGGSEAEKEEDLLSSPPGGAIDRDTEGHPTGILRERAVELVLSTMSKKSHLELKSFLSDGLSLCLSKGLTSVQTNDIAALEAYRELQRDNSLPLRVFLTPNFDELDYSEGGCSIDATGGNVELVENGTENGVEKLLRPYRPLCMPKSSAEVSASTVETVESGLFDSSLTGQSIVSDTIIDLSTAASRLIVERVKIYADGSLGAETAALRTPSDFPTSLSSDRIVEGSPASSLLGVTEAGGASVFKGEGYSGILTHSEESLKGMVSHARSLGLRVEVHAIGDAAAEQVLGAFEGAGVRPCERPVMTHCQVLGKDLVQRMVSGGVIANIQPSFVPTDMRWVQQRLSSAQQEYSYAWKTLMDRGVWVAGGSDAPIETCSPLVGMYDAIYRQERSSVNQKTTDGTNYVTGGFPKNGNSDITNDVTNDVVIEEDKGGNCEYQPEVFRPEERLSFSEVLWIYTVGAAYAAGCEGFLGSLEVGYAGDFVVLDVDILVRNTLLMTAEPELVVVGGSIEYEREKREKREEKEEREEGEERGIRDESISAISEGQEEAIPICTVLMGGPYIPGKNGKLPAFKRRKERSNTALAALAVYPPSCACRLLGKYCTATYR